MLRVEKIDDFASFLSLKAYWNALLEKSGSDNIFLTFDWLTNWWEVFGEEKELCLLLIRDEEGEIVGIAPLMISRRLPFLGRRLREVEFIGSGKCDYHDLIVVSRRNETVNRIFDFFSNEYHSWDWIRLRNVPESSPNFGSLLEVKGYKKVKQVVELCLYIRMASNWESYFQMRGKNLRRDIKKKRRRLNKIGKISFAASGNVSEAPVNQLKQIHEKKFRSTGEKTTFFYGKEMDFFERIYKTFQANGWSKIFLLKVDGRIIGYRYGFIYGQKYYDWVTSFDPEFFEYSPGKILVGEVIKFTMNENISEFDFLRGDEQYKLKWADLSRANYELAYFRDDILGLALDFYFGRMRPLLKSFGMTNYLKSTLLGRRHS